MSLLVIIAWSAGAVLYALIGLHVGYDIAVYNRGLMPSARLSPWLRGALWPLFALLGGVLVLTDRWTAERRR